MPGAEPPRLLPARGELDRAFARAAAGYDEAAVVQRLAGIELVERLRAAGLRPSVVLDVGAGTGDGTQRLKKAFRRALVVAVDRSAPMLAVARRRRGFLTPFELLLADAHALPLADGTIDLAVTSFALHWARDPARVLAELARVLRPGGTLQIATLGPGTLAELREAYHALGQEMPSPPDPETLGSALLREGFADPVLDTERYALSYADIAALLKELRAVGGLAVHGPSRGLRTPRHLEAIAAAYPPGPDAPRLTASVEVIFARAVRASPRGGSAGDTIAVPFSAIGRRQRG
jgi:malonyl-CoA O-methyltransferase